MSKDGGGSFEKPTVIGDYCMDLLQGRVQLAGVELRILDGSELERGTIQLDLFIAPGQQLHQ